MAWDVFNKLASRGSWSKEDAFYGILFAAAMADGEVAASESEEVIALAHRTATLKGISMADLQAMHSRVEGAFRKDFASALGEASGSVPKEAAPAVFAHATDIVFADGKVLTQEVEFLRSLATKLGLPDGETNKIIEVMKLKNEF